jgi:YHS domain-containing protein
MAQDQVCGCEVDETAAQFKSEFEGRTYYFCTAGCKAKFDSDPSRWAREPAIRSV